MSLRNKARLYVTFPGGEREVSPCNDDYLLTWKKDTDFGFYRLQWAQSLTFSGDDFDDFFELENSCLRCNPVDFRVAVLCEGTETDLVEGEFLLINGDFDKSHCTLEITPTVIDVYSCLLDNWTEEINILQGTPKNLVDLFFGEIQIVRAIEVNTFTGTWISAVESSYPYATSGTPPGTNLSEAWIPIYSSFQNTTQIFTGGFQTAAGAEMITDYAREFVAGAISPPGSDWVAVTGGFARPVNRGSQTIQFEPPTSTFFSEFAVSGFSTDQFNVTAPIEYGLSNGVLLSDALDLLFSECGYTVVSDFYNINPDATAPVNDPYAFAAEHLQNLMLFQKTDITNPDAFQDATSAKVTRETLLKDLKGLHNIDIRIEGTTVRIEHLSYWTTQNGIDLTVEAPKAIAGLNRWTYASVKLPQFEEWNFSEDQSTDFGETRIRYAECFTKGLKQTFQIGALLTDFPRFLGNKESGTEGIMILETVSFNGEFVVYENNEGHKLTSLLPALFTYGRPQWQGFIGGNLTDFDAVIPTKQQQPIEFTLCCGDFATWKPEERFLSQIDWGVSEEITYSLKDRCMTVTLLHEVENCSK